MTDYSDNNPSRAKDHRKVRRAQSRANRKGLNSSSSRLAVAEQLLLGPVELTINGKPRRMTTLAAIMYRLIQKSQEGDKGARRALLKFERLQQQHSSPKLEIVFVDNEYTRAFAAHEGEVDV